MAPLSPVMHEIALYCDDESGRPMAFMASFRYHRDDPYAVWVTFHVPQGDVHWVLARNLLSRGLTEPTGEGDVVVWPSIDEDRRAVVMMDFHSPEGRLEVAVRTRELLAFLRETWGLVAPGAEGANVDLDELVESLRA